MLCNAGIRRARARVCVCVCVDLVPRLALCQAVNLHQANKEVSDPMVSIGFCKFLTLTTRC